MFMRKKFMGIKIENLENTIFLLNREIEFIKRDTDLKTQEALNKLRAEMKKSLYESDMRRVKAEAKLEIYEKINTKDDANKICEMLADAIKGLSQLKPVVIAGT